MNIQEVYNKGLTDAETRVIEALRAVAHLLPHQPFTNPELEGWFSVVANEYKHLRNDKIERMSIETVAYPEDNIVEEAPIDQVEEEVVSQNLIEPLTQVVQYDKIDRKLLSTKDKFWEIVRILKKRSDAYRDQYDSRTTEGKARKEEINQQIEKVNEYK